MNARIENMIKTWKSEGRAFSHLEHDDTLFFETIGIAPIEIGITSQTGSDIVYYDTKIYSNDTNALRKL